MMFSGRDIVLPEEKERDFTVRQHKMGYAIGIGIIGAGIVISVLEILYHISAIPIWVYGVLLAIFLLGILVCLEVKNRQLAVKKNHLYYCNTWGGTREFLLEDIGSAKMVSNPSGGRDDLRLCDKKGRTLCRLETGMRNADRMLWYLYDNGIPIEMEKNTRQELADIIFQEPVPVGDLPSLSRKVYGQAGILIEDWMGKNKKLGAELDFGLVEYYGSRIKEEAQIQPEISRINWVGRMSGEDASGREGQLPKGNCLFRQDPLKQGEQPQEENAVGGSDRALPDDYLCVLEIFVKKDGYFVRDRKKRLLRMVLPVFYNRETQTAEREIRLHYNENWKKELEEVLLILAKYLPGHKFIMERIELGYELKKEIS